MDFTGKKLGVLVSVHPQDPNFEHSLRLSESALAAGLQVFFYCMSEAIHGIGDDRLQKLRARGLRLCACSQAAKKRGLPEDDLAVYCGLTMLSDILASSDRFVAFN